MKTRKELKDEITDKHQREIERLESEKALLEENQKTKLESLDNQIDIERLKLEAIEKIK